MKFVLGSYMKKFYSVGTMEIWCDERRKRGVSLRIFLDRGMNKFLANGDSSSLGKTLEPRILWFVIHEKMMPNRARMKNYWCVGQELCRTSHWEKSSGKFINRNTFCWREYFSNRRAFVPFLWSFFPLQIWRKRNIIWNILKYY